jgi:hypothetical protein
VTPSSTEEKGVLKSGWLAIHESSYAICSAARVLAGVAAASACDDDDDAPTPMPTPFIGGNAWSPPMRRRRPRRTTRGEGREKDAAAKAAKTSALQERGSFHLDFSLHGFLEQRRSGGGEAAAEQWRGRWPSRQRRMTADRRAEMTKRAEKRRCGGGRTVFFKRNKIRGFLQNGRSNPFPYGGSTYF